MRLLGSGWLSLECRLAGSLLSHHHLALLLLRPRFELRLRLASGHSLLLNQGALLLHSRLPLLPRCFLSLSALSARLLPHLKSLVYPRLRLDRSLWGLAFRRRSYPLRLTVLHLLTLLLLCFCRFLLRTYTRLLLDLLLPS